MCMVDLHSHTDISNIRLLDSTNFVDKLILKAAELGKKGIAITDHESVANHLKAIQHTRRLKKEGKIPQDFSLILGNEIYLVDSLEKVKDNYQSGVTKFPHFLLLAKNKDGHEALRLGSTWAWQQSFFTGFMERVPLTKPQLEELVSRYPDTLIATSACLGSESSIHILNGEYDKAKEFLQWCANLFGKGNFYLELQPSPDGEQRIVNEWLIKFSAELGLETVITTDTHYLRPEDAPVHSAFLNAKDGDRETSKFYAHTYLHTQEEIYQKLNYIDEEIITNSLLNTIKIGEKIEDYTIEHETIIPKIDLPEFEVAHIFKQGYEEYKFLAKMAYSEEEQDRYFVYLLEKGFVEFIPYQSISKKYFREILARIDVEVEQLYEISQQINQPMSSYYVTVSKIASIIWAEDSCDSKEEGSLLGAGRGSAVAFLCNFLLGITSVNPLLYGIEIPYWRHMDKHRSDISAADVDLDVVSYRKTHIYKRLIDYFGEDRFLQVCTYGTETSKSAIQTACRGLGIPNETAHHISSFVPFERGENWSIEDCVYGNKEKDRKPLKEFIKELEKYPLLLDTALKIQGLISKRSIHPGGVIITNESFYKTNAAQKAPNGTLITQYNLDDTQNLGSIKYDLLTIEALDKMQTTIDLLLENGEIEWQGSLRKTFNKYFHPEIITKDDPKLYELLGSGEVPDLFQFSTQLGQSTIKKVQPSNLIEMTATNSLMRLHTDSREQPIDTFIRFKNDIEEWYKEMRDYGLNEDEIKLFEDHLAPLNGVADTQESIMLLSMDERLAGFDTGDATLLRKTVAKRSEDALQKTLKLLYEKSEKLGVRKIAIDYFWNIQVSRMLNYAFSSPHVLAYSLIALVQLNMNLYYDPLYWKTAVLSVNSGSLTVEEGTKAKASDYGKTASAIGRLKSFGTKVDLPLINKANFGFTPDIENNSIIYGMKGIDSIGDELISEIIKHRPYDSFDDFYTRMYQTKIISKGQFLKLIKAGSFNEFANQIEIMKQFLVKEVNVKDSLNGQNLPRVISLGLLDTQDLISFKHIYNFKSHISKSVHSKVDKPKDRILILDSYSQAFFFNNFTDESVTGWEGNQPLISEKAFKKEYDAKMKPLMDMLNEKSFLTEYNRAQFYELWNENAEGSIEAWQMGSVSYYADKHELHPVDTNRYGISNFSDMSEEPIVLSENTGKNGRVYKNMQLYHIAGTVLEKTPNKNTITLLTNDNKVVSVKMYGSNFSSYNRQIKTDGKITSKSWFSRGEKLLVSGYRKNDTFTVKSERHQPSIQLITEIRQDGSIGLQSER